MITIIDLLKLSWIILFLATLFESLFLNNNLNILPPPQKISLKHHPLKGKNIFDIISIKKIEGLKKIYIITPSCPVCREYVPRFISDLSSIIFVHSNDIIAYENLINNYPDYKNFYIIGMEDIRKLEINFFPAVIILNEQLQVKEVSWKYK